MFFYRMHRFDLCRRILNRTTRLKVSRLSGLLLTSLALAIMVGSSALATEQTPDIQSLMTPEDFSASGLDKLSESERAHLSHWLVRYRQGITEGPAPPKTPEQRALERKITISANVVPEFQGWSGNTIFRLDNGQVWKQRVPGRLYYKGGDGAVIIRQNALGFYELVHTATGRIVGVKRIK